MRPPRRAGFGGPLVIALSVTLMLFSFGLATSFQSQGVTRAVQKSVYNDLCEGHATAALREALYRLRAAANAEGTEAYTRLRDPEFPSAFAVPASELRWSGADLDADPRFELAAGGVRVEVLRRSLAALEQEERVDYEVLGVLRVTARVEGPRGSAATRVEEYGFRVVLTAPARPFDSPTLFLADPRYLLTRDNWRGDANVAIELAVSRLTEFRALMVRTAAGFEELARKIRDLIDEAGESNAEADEALRISEELAREFAEAAEEPTYPPAWELFPPDAPTQDREGAIHLFHPSLSVYTYAPRIDMDKLGLPLLLAPLTRALEDQEPALEEALVAFKREVDAADLDFPAIERTGDAYRTSMAEQAGVLHRMLGIYKEFQDLLIEVGGEARDMVARRLRRFSLLDYAWKAPYRFAGPGAAARASAFLRGPGHPNGVVMVDDPEETLELEISGLEGRLVVAASGDVRIVRATVADPGADVLTIVARKGLEIEGMVQAALVCQSDRIRSSGEAIVGSLLLDELSPATPLDLLFRGNLTRQDAIQTGVDQGGLRPPPDPHTLHVTIGPEPLYRRLER